MSQAAVVAAAREWLGTPYRHRASCLGVGCDCLGLVRGVWRGLYGVEPMVVPPYRASPRDTQNASALRMAAERWLVPVDEPASAGQVVLFRLAGLDEAKHCGILIALDRFIHAQEKLGVVEANLTPGWARRISGRFAFPLVRAK